MESGQQRTDDLVTVCQRGDTLKPFVLQAINFNRAILTVNNPIFCHAVFSIKLSLNQKIAPAVFGAGRCNFDNKIQRACEFLALDNLIPALVADEGKVGNDGIVVTENCAGPGHHFADWIPAKVIDESNLKILDDKLVRNSGSTRHEEFSSDEFITVIIVWAGVQISDRQ